MIKVIRTLKQELALEKEILQTQQKMKQLRAEWDTQEAKLILLKLKRQQWDT